MNSLGLVILLVIVVGSFLGHGLSLLNLRYAEARGLPEELSGTFSPERYTQALAYLRANTWYGIVHGLWGLMVFVTFWNWQGFLWLDALVRSHAQSEIIAGLFFMGALGLGQSLLGLPWRMYHTFVLEARFGFNRSSAKTFIADLLKGLALTILIGAPLLYATEWFFLTTGSAAWAWVWIFLSLVQVVLLFVAPVWLMPLFFKFTPLAEGDLRSAIEAYAKKVGFQLSGIFVVDGSRRSNKANAFFTGFGRTRRIALFDTLVEKSSVEEIVAVLAHEVGHAKRGHVVKGFVISLLSSGLMFFVMGQLLGLQAMYEVFGIATPSIYTGLVFVGILYSPISTLIGIATNMLSRKHEFEADHFAGTTANPAAMIAALKKLTEGNLSNPNPHPWLVALEYSHPPTVARIRALKSL